MRITRITVLVLAVLLTASLAGCNAEKTSANISDPLFESNNSALMDKTSSPSGADGSGISAGCDSSDSPSSVPELRKPDGEPTFLIGLDGESVYTSEISQIFNYDREKKENILTETLDKELFSEVVCEGFTYGYIPRLFVNFIDDPELFEGSDKTGINSYSGEKLPDSGEFIRINVGDRFGDLTVKAAKAVFNSGFNGFDEFYEGGYIEFDGEVELTGYVSVAEDSKLYQGVGGKIQFFPDRASSVKIPNIVFERNFDNGTAHRYVYAGDGVYGEAVTLQLGNIADIDSELRAGDRNVKVKVTVKDIVLSGGLHNAVIKEIDLV